MSDTKDLPELDDHLRPDDGEATDPEYLEFLARKIKKGQEESRAGAVNSADAVWRELDLER